MATTKKKTAKKKTAKKKTSKKKKEAAPGSRGLRAKQLTQASPPAKVAALAQQIEADGGKVLCSYRDPMGGNWHLLAGLPLDKVEPTPFQRDLSETHVGRLSAVIDRLDRFVDPVVVVRTKDGKYWTPNGHHRIAAMRRLGARSIAGLVLADESVAFQILALNTEKAHNVREKSLEVIRMARALADMDPKRTEKDYTGEFEEPTYVTLGACYEKRGRFSGGAYQSVLKRVEAFLGTPLPKSIETREARADKLLLLDDQVVARVKELKEKGFDSPYLKAFVIARINPLRFQRGATAGFEETIDKMIASAAKMETAKINKDQVAAASGPPAD